MQIFLDLMNSPVRRNARGYLGLDEYLRASVPCQCVPCSVLVRSPTSSRLRSRNVICQDCSVKKIHMRISSCLKLLASVFFHELFGIRHAVH